MKRLSYTPSGRRSVPPPASEVARRHVIYLPGYDPEAESRYRMLFVREMIRYAKRFRLRERSVTPVRPIEDPTGLRWEATLAGDGWRCSTSVEVLRWDDIVQRDFARPLPLAILYLFGALAYVVATGMMVRFFRLSWKFGGVILYPPVVVLLLLACGLLLGWGVAAAISALAPLPGWGAWTVAVVVAVATFRAAHPMLARAFVWHLLHDWVFNWQHGTGLRPDYEERVDRFARHLLSVLATTDADEVLVVGHSSGAIMAVEVVARALALGRVEADQKPLGLVTLGSCLPLVVVNPRARRPRADIARLASSPDVLWVDYQAPQDWLNFAGFNPHEDLRLPAGTGDFNPVIRSARFKEILLPRTYEQILFRPFRMHFQFLMGNERPGEYDYILTILGPSSLRRRVDV